MVLDLFAGTGSISYEFASRGAAGVIAVEIDYRNYSFIKKASEGMNLNELKAIRGDAFKFIRLCKSTFDIVFADPPYKLKGISSIPDLVFEHHLVNKDGWLIIEHSAGTDFTGHPNFFNKRNYGKVNFSFFENKQ